MYITNYYFYFRFIAFVNYDILFPGWWNLGCSALRRRHLLGRTSFGQTKERLLMTARKNGKAPKALMAMIFALTLRLRLVQICRRCR